MRIQDSCVVLEGNVYGNARRQGKFCNLGPFKIWSTKIDCATFGRPIGCGGVLFDEQTYRTFHPKGSNFCWNRLGALAKKFSMTGPGDVCSRASRHWTGTCGRRGETEVLGESKDIHGAFHGNAAPKRLPGTLAAASLDSFFVTSLHSE